MDSFLLENYEILICYNFNRTSSLDGNNKYVYAKNKEIAETYINEKYIINVNDSSPEFGYYEITLNPLTKNNSLQTYFIKSKSSHDFTINFVSFKDWSDILDIETIIYFYNYKTLPTNELLIDLFNTIEVDINIQQLKDNIENEKNYFGCGYINNNSDKFVCINISFKD